MDTPITESAFVGAAIGAATTGLRPVVELMFVDFMGVCFDQIYNQAAKFRYMFGGKAVTPIVSSHHDTALASAPPRNIRSALYPIFTHIPGLKCVIPSTPYDAKGLLIQAIRDNDPVIFFEHKMLYSMQGRVPEEPYAIPFGEANFVREGSDVTIVTLGRMVHIVSEAADALAAARALDCEVIDLRTTSPWTKTVFSKASRRPARLVVVDEASPRCNIATDVSALVAQRAFRSLKAPIRMVTPPHTPVPFSDVLEDQYLPNAAKVAAAVRRCMRYKA